LEIIDIKREHERMYHMCLKDYWTEAGQCIDRREVWYERARKQGLRVRLARDDDGTIAGLIQYIPIEYSFVDGRDLHFILCTWVHGYKEGIGDRRGKGIGEALLAAAEEDAKWLGAKGMAAWGLATDEWMNAPWFVAHGYREADRAGDNVLVWKPFAKDAKAPRWLKQKKRPSPIPGKVVVTSLNSGWCVSANVLQDTARVLAHDHAGDVVYNAVDTSDRATMLEWGSSEALFIDDERVDAGEPPTHDQLKKMIERKVRELRREGKGRPRARGR